MKKKILRYSLIALLIAVSVLILFSISYKSTVSEVDSFIENNPARLYLNTLSEESKDSSTILHRLLNTISPDDKKWIPLITNAGKAEEVKSLSQELESFAFPLIEQINFCKTGSPLIYTAQQNERDLLVFSRMTLMKNILLKWGEVCEEKKRACRYLLIIANAIKKPVFPVVFELQLSFVSAANTLSGNPANEKDEKDDIPDFIWGSFEELVKFREFSSIRDIISLSKDASNVEVSTLRKFFLYRAAKRQMADYKNLKEVLLKRSESALLGKSHIEPSLRNTDPILCRLFLSIIELSRL